MYVLCMLLFACLNKRHGTRCNELAQEGDINRHIHSMKAPLSLATPGLRSRNSYNAVELLYDWDAFVFSG